MADRVNTAIFAMFWCFITILFFGASVVFGQEVTTTTLPVIASPGLDQAQHVIDQLNNGWVMTAGILLVELLLRAFKTQNPKSLLYVISNVFKMISQVCTFLAQLADKVLQRTKE